MTQGKSFMALALDEAKKALDEGEMPVGAVVVRDGRVICACRNRREALKDPTAHAEMLAIREAAKVVGDWRLSDCDMYVTLEPCPMCAGAIAMARMRSVSYALCDLKYGCAGSVYRITEDPAFNSFTPAYPGEMEKESQELLRRFFSGIRGSRDGGD